MKHLDEYRDADFVTVVELCGFGDIGCRIAPGARFCFNDFLFDEIGQRNIEGTVVMKENFNLHVVDQKIFLVTQQFLIQAGFLVRLVVRKHIIVAVDIGERKVAGNQSTPVDFLHRPVGLVEGVARHEILDFATIQRLTLARFGELELGNHAGVPVDFNFVRMTGKFSECVNAVVFKLVIILIELCNYLIANHYKYR